MKCQSKHKEMGATFICTEEASEEITVTTFVPHLNNKKQVKVRCLCKFHAKRYRNKLGYQIHELLKNKSFTTKEI